MFEAIITGMVLAVIIIIPISLKWELKENIIIPFAVIVGFTSGVVFNNTVFSIDYWEMVVCQSLFIMIVSVCLLSWRFFRDPEREIIPDDSIILSPADGKVVYIKRYKNGELPLAVKHKKEITLNEFTQTNILAKEGYQVGISMSFLDVHVNRSPISGRIEMMKHIKGSFHSLKKKEAIVENERTLLIIDGKGMKIGIVQIASRLVRMIVPYVKQGDVISIGAKIGRIRFGSQVDMLLPEADNLTLHIKENDFVKAGISKIASIKKSLGENNYEIQ